MPYCELPVPERCVEVFAHTIAHKYESLALLFPLNIKFATKGVEHVLARLGGTGGLGIGGR